MLTCKEASVLISEGQDRKLRMHERVGLRMHLWICANCARFDRQMRLMRRVLRSQTNPETMDAQGPDLSAEAHERIRRAMVEQGKHRD